MNLPEHIFSGEWDTSHIQGIAIDKERKYLYLSFTTILVKMDITGNVIGTVAGLTGHLGDLDYNDDDRRVYGSLEYKSQESFYLAIFDGDKIDRVGMDAENDNIMTAVYMNEVVSDFICDMNGDGRFDGDIADTDDHRYGCSGIDGISFGPVFGEDKTSTPKLMLAYGIYRNVNRDDNDYQIILQFDVRELDKYKRPLNQINPHKSGPEFPEAKYFIYTGNTTFGVQNLEYDYYTGDWFMTVYNGTKDKFPNYPLYIIDGSKKPYSGEIIGQPEYEEGLLLSLKKDGIYDEKSGVYGWQFKYGQTGLISLDNEYYYISHNGKSNGKQLSNIYLYRWNRNADEAPFERVVY